MRFGWTLIAAGLGAAFVAGCADTYDRPYDTSAGTTTTTVVRDAYGNPVASGTTVRDAYGNPVSSNSTMYRDAYGRPVPSGSSVAPGAAPRDCRATPLHQDRPGGSDYDPLRGAPSC